MKDFDPILFTYSIHFFKRTLTKVGSKCKSTLPTWAGEIRQTSKIVEMLVLFFFSFLLCLYGRVSVSFRRRWHFSMFAGGELEV